jgi:Ca2+-binding EF-hand superfamily protein
LWSQYDTDGNGHLDKRELRALAGDVVDRILKIFADHIRARNPGMGENAVKKVVEKERVFILPGKTQDESVRELTRMLLKDLDVNKDGVVTKTELLYQWNAFSASLHKMSTGNNQNMDCTVM